MNRLISAILIFSSFSLVAQSFEEKVTSASNVRLSVTNVGTFGNAFRGYRDGTSNESCEYPAGSGVEHLFESGIWVGAERNGTRLVTTAAVDAPQGYQTGSSGFEFTTPIGATLRERSSLKDNPNFSPLAVSHQDFIADFTDKNLIIPGTNTQILNHTNPLFIDVQLRTYNFNFAFSDFVVFVDMDIVNGGDLQGGENVLDSVFFGLWANTVVRNINITPPGTGGAAFYNKGGNGYIDSLQMAYCYDHSGDVGFTNSYIAQKFLGASDKFGFHHPRTDSTFGDNYNAWQFNSPGTGTFQQPLSTDQQYQRLSRGIDDEPCWNVDDGNCGGGTFQEQLNQAGNRSDLVSVGPFRDFRKGDTIKISYAFILAPKIDDGNPHTDNTPAQMAQLFTYADRAQTAYFGEDANENGILDPEEDKDGNGEITRFILPSPPDIPKTRVEVADQEVDVYWSNNSEFSIDPISQTMDFEGYRIYLTKLGYDVVGVPNLLADLIPVDEYDIKDNGFANEIGLEEIELMRPIGFDSEGELIFADSIVAARDTMFFDTLVSDTTITDTVINGVPMRDTTIVDTLLKDTIYKYKYYLDSIRYEITDPTIYYYKYTISNLLNGWQYAIGVSAFDTGNDAQNLDPLESSLLANNFRVFPGKKANDDMDKNEPYAYPNPYYFGSSWEGTSNFQEQSRKLVFANLPKRCVIRIFTPAGDLIDEIHHDEDYNGDDIRWFDTFGSENGENKFSGGEHAWDLLSNYTQIISRGVYIFAVEDLESGEVKKGKFTILK